jgi:hypothetical protein
MCQTKAEGGKRCDCDTSSVRRLRRKASNLLSTFNDGKEDVAHQGVTISKAPGESILYLKEYADELKEELRNAPTDPVERSAFDEQFEYKMTGLGVGIANEAELLAGYNKEELDRRVEKESLLELKIAEKNQKDIFRRLEPLNEKYEALLEEKGMQNYRTLDKKALQVFSESEREFLTERERVMEEYKASFQEVRDISLNVDERKNTIYLEANQQLAKSYQDVLSQIRPLGGNVIVHPKSDKEAVELINTTVAKHYPTAWLEIHNNADDPGMKVKITTERPGYMAANKAGEYTREGAFLDDMSEDNVSQLQVAFGENFHRTTLLNNKYSDNNAGYITYTVNEEIYSPLKHGIRRKADGWELRPTYASSTLPEMKKAENRNEMIKILTTPRWVKVGEPKEETALLTTFSPSNPSKWFNEARPNRHQKVYAESSTYHEFGHRMEQVFPDNLLARQEKAFLKRRTGKTDVNFLATVRNDNPLRKEYFHDGGFVEQYTGREYFGSDEKSYEVFTTGVEALYSGIDLGGLAGNSTHHPHGDDDHRGFVLGALATL